MGRSTDTNDIRTYCFNHMGGVFDTNYLSKRLFFNVPVANFRKYVTRLEQEGLLKKISKGLFFIGESELDDRERIIKHYTSDGSSVSGIVGGFELIKSFGFFPGNNGVTKIYSNKAIGIKHLYDYQIEIIESHASYSRSFGGESINCALELIHLRRYVSSYETNMYYHTLSDLLDEYNDDLFSWCVDFSLYPREVFIRLANYLDVMHISNKVMEIYDHKIRNTISRE